MPTKIEYKRPYGSTRDQTVTLRLTQDEKTKLLNMVNKCSGRYSWQRLSQSDIIMYSIDLLHKQLFEPQEEPNESI